MHTHWSFSRYLILDNKQSSARGDNGAGLQCQWVIGVYCQHQWENMEGKSEYQKKKKKREKKKKKNNPPAFDWQVMEQKP